MFNAELGIGCGGFTYTLEYIDGPLTGTLVDHTATYSFTETPDLINNEQMTGAPSEFDWLTSL